MDYRKALALLAALLGCAACEYAPDMLDRTIAYNRTVANSTNQVLLLNVVRASERLPTYYTRLEGDASSLAVTPNASLSLPLGNARSFENDVNTGPTGAITSGTSKGITSLASFASALGLQASESNLLTLQTLDDQKYQNGMMTPVSLKNIQAFQDEGYQRDLLFMMFFSSIGISNGLMSSIDDAVDARCGEIERSAVPGASMSFARQACSYAASGPYQSLFDPAKSHPANYSFSLKTCRDTGGAIADDAPKDMVHFVNAPARESRAGSSDPHPVVCFQILLNDLLILGLEVGAPQNAPAELVDTVPDTVAKDPQFRSQMIQQNLIVRETSAGVAAICRKKSESTGYTLNFTNPSPQEAGGKPAALNTLMTQLGVSGRNEPPAPPPPPKAKPAPAKSRAAAAAPAAVPALPNPYAAYPDDPRKACQQADPLAPAASDTVLETAADTEGNPQSKLPKVIKLTTDKVMFSTRSFQGMIYYLGETLRYEEFKSADPINFPRVLGRNPAVGGAGYFEVMFYGSTQLDSEDTAVAVRDDAGKSYAIPRPCMRKPIPGAGPMGCSAEYPDNESLQLLNFVNQVWGLQKESVSSPTSPLVVVSPQ
jgi:hypothetical protein